jgi:hypothetical protein
MKDGVLLASRSFRLVDQKEFAALSGDFNPMHLDPVAARRTQAGAPVVHGIHLLVWALNALAAAHKDLPSLRSLRARFTQVVYLDLPVEAQLVQLDAQGARLSVCVHGGAMAQIQLVFGAPDAEATSLAGFSTHRIHPAAQPVELSLEEISGFSGQLAFAPEAEAVASLYPDLARWLGAQRVVSLLTSTYLVGMVCPGLHSLYGEIAVDTCAVDDLPDALAFRASEPRYRMVKQQVAGGGLRGTIKCFVRMPPVEQASMATLEKWVTAGEFAGQVVLVVGGSRGLGELTAKLIASGGGEVILTWRSGKQEADKVAKAIRETGGRCEVLAYDARQPAEEQLASMKLIPTHLYYFATPPIFQVATENYSSTRFSEFSSIYLDGFAGLLQALWKRQPRVSAFYPSSVAIEQRPRGVTEYAMAKAAGEILCADLSLALESLHITVSRLPRLSTDQTASITEVQTASSLETLLPLIREVQSWPR